MRLFARKASRQRLLGTITATTLLLLFAGATLLLAIVPEARTLALLQLAPARARDANFVRLARPDGPTVYLLGTIHNRHLDTEEYSLLHVQAVIQHLRPDLLLVESRPEELAKGYLADGPIEMLFANLQAREAGIQVEGMDWWTKEHLGLRSSSEQREDRMAANILARLPERGVVLVLTGISHVAEFVPRLAKAGYQEAPFPEAEKRRLLDTAGMRLTFPPGTARYLQTRIRDTEAELRAEGKDPDASDYLAARRRLLEMVERTGEELTGGRGRP